MITNNNLNHEPLIEYLKTVPYDISRDSLYTAAELYEGFDPGQPEPARDYFDKRVYRHFLALGKLPTDVKEAVARTLHDQGIRIALADFIKARNYLQLVGVMGGHALLRTDAMYRQVVFLSKRLTELGFCMLSGGGPGAMEATHLGAWMAGRGDDEVEEALRIIALAPSFSHEGWVATAFEVRRKFPQTNYESIGIPTWLYGHEPPTPFATHIAKFFDNSIREDSVLMMPFGGVIYTPGSAGTMQEIFQNAVKNHYLSFGFSSPMIFLGAKFWKEEMPVYPLMQRLMATGKYKNLNIVLTDDLEVVVQQLLDFQDQVKAHPEAFRLK